MVWAGAANMSKMFPNYQSPLQEELKASNDQAVGFRARAEQAEALAGRLDNQLEQLQVSGEDAAQVIACLCVT